MTVSTVAGGCALFVRAALPNGLAGREGDLEIDEQMRQVKKARYIWYASSLCVATVFVSAAMVGHTAVMALGPAYGVAGVVAGSAFFASSYHLYEQAQHYFSIATRE